MADFLLLLEQHSQHVRPATLRRGSEARAEEGRHPHNVVLAMAVAPQQQAWFRWVLHFFVVVHIHTMSTNLSGEETQHL